MFLYVAPAPQSSFAIEQKQIKVLFGEGWMCPTECLGTPQDANAHCSNACHQVCFIPGEQSGYPGLFRGREGPVSLLWVS